MIPRGTMWRLSPRQPTMVLMLEATNDHFTLPEKALVGRHAIFDPAMLDTPVMNEAFRDHQALAGETEIKRAIDKFYGFDLSIDGILRATNILLAGRTVVVAGYGMCGRGFGPHFIFAWPNSRTSVMGGEQAAKVMSIITRDKWVKEGKAIGEAEQKQLAAIESNIVKQFDQQSTAFAGSARLFDDGLIDPRDTRKVLGLTLSICREARARQTFPNSYGVARL